jgi:hypothetical protein
MFQNVVAEYDIETLFGKGNGLNIHFDGGQRALQIGRNVSLGRFATVCPIEFVHQTDFGCYVQESGLGGKHSGLTFNPQPQQAVAFESQTIGA